VTGAELARRRGKMELDEALKEVLDAAKQPKQYPPGATPMALKGDDFRKKPVNVQAWHDSLTPAQETVCRWIWETCGQHYEPWEKFEVGFLFDYNVNHELAVWSRVAIVFDSFVKRHPSVNKRDVIYDLCRLSAGTSVKKMSGSRAKELTELWKAKE
jgi:hypothetical protein